MRHKDTYQQISTLRAAVDHLFKTNIANERTQSILIRDPILIDCNESVPSNELREYLTICAQELAVGYSTIDIRLLCRYPLKTSYTNKSSNSIAASPMLQSTKIEDVVCKAPCILHIESFDAVYHDPAQQHSSNPEDSQEEMFLRAFRAFVNDLYSHIEALPKLITEEINQRSVVIVVSTSSSSGIKAQLKSMFGAEVKLSLSDISSDEFSALLAHNLVFKTAPIDTSVTPRYSTHSSSSVVSNSVGISPDAHKLLYGHVCSHTMSCATTTLLINEVKRRALSRVHDTVWMTALGVGTSMNTKLHTNVHTITTTNVNTTNIDTMVQITTADVKKTLAEVPCLNAFDTTRGTNSQKSGSKQATIAPVHWADIGGLDRVRGEILEVLELPFKHPTLFFPGCPRRQGVLLYGPPGTGKTLVARAVATECGMAFISVKGPELLDMYVGESEKNVRDVFSRAREAAPCVLFFDEIDSLAPARARGNASGGGIMDRMVSQLLTEMDMVVTSNAAAVSSSVGSGGGSGESENSGEATSSDGDTTTPTTTNNTPTTTSITTTTSATIPNFTTPTAKVTGKLVFIIAATNRPDLLDPALLRPGRFDRKIYLGVCKDIPARLQILHAQTRKFSLSPQCDLTIVAEALPPNVTGADIGAVTSSAYSTALKRKLVELRNQARVHLLGTAENIGSTADKEPDDLAVQSYINQLDAQELTIVVEQSDLLHAAKHIQPSVVDLAYYESLGEVYDDTRGGAEK